MDNEGCTLYALIRIAFPPRGYEPCQRLQPRLHKATFLKQACDALTKFFDLCVPKDH